MSEVRFTKSKRGGDMLIVGDYLYNAQGRRPGPKKRTTWRCWKMNPPTSCRCAVKLNEKTMEVEMRHEHNHPGDAAVVQLYEDRVQFRLDNPDALTTRVRKKNDKTKSAKDSTREKRSRHEVEDSEEEQEEDDALGFDVDIASQSSPSPSYGSEVDNSGLPSNGDVDLEQKVYEDKTNCLRGCDIGGEARFSS